MYKFKVYLTPHLAPGYTLEQAKFPPGTFHQVYEKQVNATLESEAEGLAFLSIENKIMGPDSVSEAIGWTAQIVRLSPLQPPDAELADALRRRYKKVPLQAKLDLPGRAPCWLCDGFGFVSDLNHEFLLCRCHECNRFKDEERMFTFVYAKLTAPALNRTTSKRE